jgi:hypothetical protein
MNLTQGRIQEFIPWRPTERQHEETAYEVEGLVHRGDK